jgi:hypothetical protein
VEGWWRRFGGPNAREYTQIELGRKRERKVHPRTGTMLSVGMRIAGIVLGALGALSGAVFVAQGLNLPFAPPSSMTGDRTWLVIGAGMVVVGIGLAAVSARRRGARRG